MIGCANVREQRLKGVHPDFIRPAFIRNEEDDAMNSRSEMLLRLIADGVLCSTLNEEERLALTDTTRLSESRYFKYGRYWPGSQSPESMNHHSTIENPLHT
jgi:hypothetical protein